MKQQRIRRTTTIQLSWPTRDLIEGMKLFPSEPVENVLIRNLQGRRKSKRGR